MVTMLRIRSTLSDFITKDHHRSIIEIVLMIFKEKSLPISQMKIFSLILPELFQYRCVDFDGFVYPSILYESYILPLIQNNSTSKEMGMI